MGLFYKLGQLAGPKLRKGRWLWESVTGSEADIVEAEHATGADLAAALREQAGVDDDVELRRWVRKLGGELAECVANKQRKFAFEVIHGDEPNAMALPGGFVFINRPLIDLLNGDADETAFVLGHEMAHVIKQHAVDRLISDATFNTAMRAGPAAGVLGRWMSSTGRKLLSSAYSQDNEFMADKLGMRLAQAAGHDPHAAIRMLHRLKIATGAPDGEPLSTYFATHPPFDVRIVHLDRYLRGVD
ncbi:MAG: M48 family metalloprotease [Phycisphaera sp.]|nr:M48 family metalloprotease [Phycisphaera sp.]